MTIEVEVRGPTPSGRIEAFTDGVLVGFTQNPRWRHLGSPGAQSAATNLRERITARLEAEALAAGEQ